ncbi:hypothetical protein D3C76_1051210 [compost metagenome]
MVLLVISASLAATVNISVMFVRAIGNPKLVTILTYVQVLMYIIVLFIIGELTVHTLIIASITGLFITNATLLGYIIYRSETSMVSGLLKSVLVTAVLSTILFITSRLTHGLWLHFLVTLVGYLLLLVIEYKAAQRRANTSKKQIETLEYAMESH